MIFRCNYRPLVKVSRFWFYNGWIRSIFSIHAWLCTSHLSPTCLSAQFFLLWNSYARLNGIPFWGLKPTDFSEVALFFSHWSYSFPPLPVQPTFTFFCIHRNRTWETSFCLHLCGNSVTSMLSHIKPAKIFPRKNDYWRSKCCPNSRPPPLSPAPRLHCFTQGWRAESQKLSKGREVSLLPMLCHPGKCGKTLAANGKRRNRGKLGCPCSCNVVCPGYSDLNGDVFYTLAVMMVILVSAMISYSIVCSE